MEACGIAEFETWGTADSEVCVTSVRCVLFLFLALALAGCASPDGAAQFAPYRPENTFVRSPVLPPTVRRVAILPVTAPDRSAALMEGRERFGSVLRAELIKTRKFEVVSIEPELLEIGTGRNEWRDHEVLPEHFLNSFAGTYGCDAVLFTELTVYRAYPPQAIGWRMRLVDIRTGETLWAGDELFDAGQPAVRTAARQYARRQQTWGDPVWAIRYSPQRFGQYAVAEMLGTLPER